MENPGKTCLTFKSKLESESPLVMLNHSSDFPQTFQSKANNKTSCQGQTKSIKKISRHYWSFKKIDWMNCSKSKHQEKK